MGNPIIKYLTENIQTKLNEELTNNSDLNEAFTNTSFEFRIVTDTAEYKDAERRDNAVRYYIHGLASVVGSEKEGLGGDSANIGVSIRTDFLIPFVNTSDEGVKLMMDTVRDIIDNALSESSGETKEIDKMMYYVASTYSISQPGIRDVRPKVGDSITLTVNCSYYLVAQGISSESIELDIAVNEDSPGVYAYERIFARRIGIYRKLVSEGVVPSEAGGSTKNVVSGSVLSISFDTPVRLGYFFEIAREYALHGTIIPFRVRLTLPKRDGNADVSTYTMVISDAGINGELNLAASSDYTLVEYYGG